jgi:CheY-like chemotaxis protein
MSFKLGPRSTATTHLSLPEPSVISARHFENHKGWVEPYRSMTYPGRSVPCIGCFLPLYFVSCWLALPGFAQVDNPFGSSATPAPSLSAPASSASGLTASSATPLTDPHPVVSSLRNNPPQTPVEIGKAILFMKRIERWQEAARYLDELAKRNIDDATANKIVRATGLETWLALETRSTDLNKEQLATIRRVIDGASQATRNPTALSEGIRYLYSSALADRKRGVLAIQSAGEDGLAALMQSVAQSDASPPPILSELIATMGKSSEEALKAAVATSTANARHRFFQIAARVPGASFIPEISAGLYSVPQESSAYSVLSKALSPAGQAIPSITTVQSYLVDALKSELVAYKAMNKESINETSIVWRWALDEKSMKAESDNQAGKHLERAYQLAELLLNLPQNSAIDVGLAQAIAMERHFHITPRIDIEASEAIQSFNRGRSGSSSEWELHLVAAFDAADKQSLPGAQLRLLQIAAALRDKVTANTFALEKALARCLHSGVPAIRYMAGITVKDFGIANVDATHRNAFRTVQAELEKLEGKPLAVVVGGATERCDALTTHLNQLAVRSVVFSNARDTIRFIQGAEPIEMIFIVDRVLEMKLYELIQRLRTSPRLKAIPIVVMTDAFSVGDRALVMSDGLPRVEYGILTTNLETTTQMLQAIQQNATIPMLDSIDRITFRTLAETAP